MSLAGIKERQRNLIPFTKGVSGNPSGRPAGFEDISNSARALAPLAIMRLGDILRDEKMKPAATIHAAELILERAYGKAPSFKTSDPEGFRDVLQLSDEQIKQRLATIRGLLLEHGIDPVRLPGQDQSVNKPEPIDGG